METIELEYKDEFGNTVFLNTEDDDVHVTVKYDKKSVGRCGDDTFFLTRQDFEKLKEIYNKLDAQQKGDEQ